MNQESCARQPPECFFPVQIQEAQRKHIRPYGRLWGRPFPLKMSLQAALVLPAPQDTLALPGPRKLLIHGKSPENGGRKTQARAPVPSVSWVSWASHHLDGVPAPSSVKWGQHQAREVLESRGREGERNRGRDRALAAHASQK